MYPWTCGVCVLITLKFSLAPFSMSLFFLSSCAGETHLTLLKMLLFIKLYINMNILLSQLLEKKNLN